MEALKRFRMIQIIVTNVLKIRRNSQCMTKLVERNCCHDSMFVKFEENVI